MLEAREVKGIISIRDMYKRGLIIIYSGIFVICAPTSSKTGELENK